MNEERESTIWGLSVSKVIATGRSLLQGFESAWGWVGLLSSRCRFLFLTFRKDAIIFGANLPVQEMEDTNFSIVVTRYLRVYILKERLMAKDNRKNDESKKVKQPIIQHMATLWTLTDYGGKKGEWSTDQKIKQIKKAGFDGFCGRVPDITVEHVEKYGLLFAATVDIGTIKEIRPKLRAIKEANARCVNVQLLDHDTPADRALSTARRVMEAADRLEMDVAIEVHRDTCTETPEKAYALAEDLRRRRNAY